MSLFVPMVILTKLCNPYDDNDLTVILLECKKSTNFWVIVELLNFKRIKLAWVSIVSNNLLFKFLQVRDLFTKLFFTESLNHFLFFKDSWAAMHDNLDTLKGFLYW